MSCNAVSFTAPRVEQHDIDAELAALTEQERTKAHQDVHGTQRTMAPESHFTVRKALAALEKECSAITSSTDRKWYDQAQIRCPEYANSQAFKINFLRADDFNAKLAAKRLMRFWTEKVDLFGETKAFKALCMQDLYEEDQAALLGGGFTILPETDQAGRGIIVSCRAKWDNRRTHRKSMLRVVWYIMHCALEVETIQKRGVVVLSTANLKGCSFSFFDLKLDRMFVRHLLKVLPIKWVALHQFSKKSSMVEFLLPNFLHLLGPHMRIRYRLHYIAEEKEHLPELHRYGMRSNVLPSEMMGSLQFDYKEWLISRRFLEAARCQLSSSSSKTHQRCCSNNTNATFADQSNTVGVHHKIPSMGKSNLRDVVNAKRRFLGLSYHADNASSSSSTTSTTTSATSFLGNLAATTNLKDEHFRPDSFVMSDKARSLLNYTKRAHSECMLQANRVTNEAVQAPPPKKIRSADRVGSYNRIKDLFRSTIVRSNWSSQHETDELSYLFTATASGSTRPTSPNNTTTNAIRDQLERPLSPRSLSPRSLSPHSLSPAGTLSPR